ncbi:MAG: CaiB/BaiF CoA-transferase family protein [Candidatus Bathyarchaeota archaeon]|jgi:CoA:oxalate CoA-transferase|nr:CaiB/BaiF CoA-transferase family protein [Candidatus Bathyarchaeota archaeon]MDP7443945.1 CaiB/BaiF CoA-transferase family protein [Candidatus Bathyarchaeota archaeon]|tara:strand:+ start:488 stop:1639 length:1152 start_codon:yes stop_codon:yes gene_type:complete
MKDILEDIRVLDLTQFWFGPYCTLLLAEMGAEVIRVEPPWGGIDRIADGALFGGSSYTFHHHNLNKKGLTLNLKSLEGIKLFKSLVKASDVVVQNFRQGSMEKLGLGYEVLKGLNPKIIYAALSGFGQYGPYAKRGSFAMIAEAMSGHSRLTGDLVDPNGPPREMAQAYGDLAPAIFAAMSIVSAIRYRDKTQQGQMIDVAQLDCMVALNTATTGYNLSGLKLWELKDKFPMGRGFGGLIKTVDNGWIRYASFSPRIIERLKSHLGVDEIDEEKIAEQIGKKNREEAVEFFVKAGVPVAPVYDVDEVVIDPHLKAREMFVDVKHPKAGAVRVPNFPVKFSETPGKIVNAAPLLGEHSKEILVSLLGLSGEQVFELEKKGVTST